MLNRALDKIKPEPRNKYWIRIKGVAAGKSYSRVVAIRESHINFLIKRLFIEFHVIDNNGIMIKRKQYSKKNN